MVFGVVDQRRRVVEDSADEIRRRRHFDALCREGSRKQQRFYATATVSAAIRFTWKTETTK
jgi:hypothetical protein